MGTREIEKPITFSSIRNLPRRNFKVEYLEDRNGRVVSKRIYKNKA